MNKKTKTNAHERAFIDNVANHTGSSRISATEVLPIVLGLIQPRSVIDVGCSVGVWLSVCQELGVDDVLGVDGPYVDTELLQIPRDKFLPSDLRKRIQIDRKFDLVISLEVAEHLPLQCAPSFVDSLVGLGPVVLFSAAVPFQGGTGHINEQWPDYWNSLFKERGFLVIDCIRKEIWKKTKVDRWYKQNVLLFVEESFLARCDLLKQKVEISQSTPLSIIHPDSYLGEADPKNIDPKIIPFGKAMAAIGIHAKRKIRTSLHWRLQRLLFK